MESSCLEPVRIRCIARDACSIYLHIHILAMFPLTEAPRTGTDRGQQEEAPLQVVHASSDASKPRYYVDMA